MAALSAKIAEARKAGYSDDEITSFLGSDSALAPKIATAKEAGYSSADILGHLEKSPSAAPKPAAKQTLGQEASGFMANLNRSLLIGDEVTAGAHTVGNVLTGKVPLRGAVDDFKSELGKQNALADDFQARRPLVSSGLAKGIGNAALLAMPGPKMLAGGGRGINAARGAVGAATYASAAGALDRGSLEERAKAASDPVALGANALVGGALGAAASGTKKAPAAKPVPKMNPEELSAAKTAAYKAADDAGVKYAPEAIDGLISNVAKDVASANINPARHPRAASMVADIQALAGKEMTLTELDQLRQVVRRDVASAPDAAEKFFGRKIIDQIDQFIETAGPDQVLAGSADDASRLIKTARDLNARVRKTEAVTKAVDKAELRAGSTGSGGNVENAIRQNLRVVLEKTPNLSAEETEALRSIVLGDKTQNALRQVGKLSPQGNGLMLAGHLAAAVPTGGMSGMAALAGAGAKAGAEAMTKAKVAKLLDLISAEKTTASELRAVLPTLAANDPGTRAVRQAVASRLARMTGAASATSNPRPQNALATYPR